MTTAGHFYLRSYRGVSTRSGCRYQGILFQLSEVDDVRGNVSISSSGEVIGG